MRHIALPLAALCAATLVAACSQSEAEPDVPDVAAQATPVAAPSSATPAAQVAVVPDRFHGIWDAATANCDPASDTRVEIAERGITFYESHGAVTALTVESPESIAVDLAMQGEGEKWIMRHRFTLSDADRTLTPAALDGEDLAPLPLKRCA